MPGAAGFPTDVPRPAPGAVEAPFWQHLRNGELRLQRCAACGTYRHPPGPRCTHCRSGEAEWVPASGTGEVWSYTVCHPPVLPAFAAHTPYAAVVVRLDEGVFMAVLPRAHQLYFMVARAQAFDHALHGNGDTVDFGRVGFRDHGDAERAACRRHLLTDDFRALHADHFQRR